MEGSRLNLGARCSGDGCRRTASTAADRAQCHVGETCRPPSTDPPPLLAVYFMNNGASTGRLLVACILVGQGTGRPGRRGLSQRCCLFQFDWLASSSRPVPPRS